MHSRTYGEEHLEFFISIISFMFLATQRCHLSLHLKHPPLPAFTLFLCLVISIAIIVRHWLPESEAVFFLLGCCNKYHRPSSMWTVEIYFLTVIGAEESKVKLNADSMTREEPLSGSREDCFFSALPPVRREEGLSQACFARALFFLEGSAYDLITSTCPTSSYHHLRCSDFSIWMTLRALCMLSTGTEESTPAPFRGGLCACAVQWLNEDPLLFEVLFICHWFLSVSFMLKIYFHICHLL